jgi:hypothetical protein
MKGLIRNIVKIFAVIGKSCTFASIVLATLQSAKTASQGDSFAKKVYLTQDNIPSRLTSVAHLGGFLFYKPLAL